MPSILLPEIKECKFCSKEFKPERKNQVHCTKDCANRISYPDLKNEYADCPVCKNRFPKTRRDQKYCSSICRSLYNLQRLETLHIPKEIFESSSRLEIVNRLEQFLEYKGYFLNKSE